MRLRKPDPHGWNSWTSYCGAHDGKLGDFDHFVIEDRVERAVGLTVANWVGEIICQDGYEIHVRRLQLVDMRHGSPWVRTKKYSYHALQRRAGLVRNLFRYDNIHTHLRHDSEHHRHRFDRNGVEIDPPEHVGIGGWPNLGQVLDEVHVYWTDHL